MLTLQNQEITFDQQVILSLKFNLNHTIQALLEGKWLNNSLLKYRGWITLPIINFY